MKQNIDAYMLFELPDTNIKKLSDILGCKVTLEEIKHDRTEYLKYKETNGYTIQIEDICDKCTIGKMFEIIDKEYFIELNPQNMDSQYDYELKIIERKDCKNSEDYVFQETYTGNELCDVLFEAIADQCLL